MWTEASRGRIAAIERKTKRYPSDLTVEEWKRITADARAVATRSARVGDGGCGWSSWGPGNGHGWFRELARWSLDFVSDAFACSRRFRILCEVDD